MTIHKICICMFEEIKNAMKREIKFRGLRSDGKSWVYGYYYKYNGKSIISSEDHSDDADTYYNDEVIPESVGQYTGLKDKNGKDIYENDIIKDGTGRILTIQWSPKFASFCLNSEDWMFLHYFGEACDANDVEVIGNINKKTP